MNSKEKLFVIVNENNTSLVAGAGLKRCSIRSGEHAKHVHEVEDEISLAFVIMFNKASANNELLAEQHCLPRC
jgi:hypothetical protein